MWVFSTHKVLSWDGGSGYPSGAARGYVMSQEESQENGATSLEAEILRRYTQQSEEPPSEAEPSITTANEEDEAESTEDDMQRGYKATDEIIVQEAPEEETLENQSSDDSDSRDTPGPPEEPTTVVDDETASGDEVEADFSYFDERPAPQMEPLRAPVAMPSSPEEVVATLRRLREDVGQISELSTEEENIVAAFALAFLKLMEPLTKALPVDISILPRELGFVEKANVVPKGDLVILHADGRMESLDLTEQDNRDLLITVVSDVMPRFNNLISQRRDKIEKRINFLSNVTKELQTIADSFETVG